MTDVLKLVGTVTPPRPSWRTLPMLLALALPSVAAACSPAVPTIAAWQGNPHFLPEGWEARPCSAEWQAQAGEAVEVACYKLAAGTVAEDAAQKAFLSSPMYLEAEQLSGQHQRFIYADASWGEQVLETHDKGASGLYANFVWRKSSEQVVREQLGAVVTAAENPNVQWAASPPAWLSWLLGPEQKPCSEFAPIDGSLFASCTVEQRRARIMDYTMGDTKTYSIPFITFQLRPSSKLQSNLTTRQPYAAYEGWSCSEVNVRGLQPKHYADIWVLR